MHSPVGSTTSKPQTWREVIAIRRVAEAALHRVADQAAVRAARRSRPSKAASCWLREEVVQLLLGDAGLDGDVGEVFVEVDDAVQSAEIEEDAVSPGPWIRSPSSCRVLIG